MQFGSVLYGEVSASANAIVRVYDKGNHRCILYLPVKFRSIIMRLISRFSVSDSTNISWVVYSVYGVGAIARASADDTVKI